MRSGILITALGALFSAAPWQAAAGADETLARMIARSAADGDGRAAFTFDAGAFAGDVAGLPIGVFDSGIGGLTVLEAVLELDAFHNDTLKPGADGRRDFEKESFIYFGDQANMPYGNYPAAGREEYLRELILKDAVFLLGRRWWMPGEKEPRHDKPPVKAIVIACNTATAFGLEDIRAAVKEWGLPVIVAGVVEAGARGVSESMAADDPRRGVAVLATAGTCKTEAYPRAIGRATGLAGKMNPVVVQQGCLSLAGAIEGDPAFLRDAAGARRSVADIVREDVRHLMETHRSQGGPAISTVVLGCTHFPLAAREITEAFAELRREAGFERLIAEQVNLVNPAELTAKELFRGLALARLRSARGPDAAARRCQFYISTPNPRCAEARLSADGRALDTEYKYQRAAGRLEVEDTINVPMRLQDLPAASAGLICGKLPNVAREMR